ncbi:hypothetical protein T484DRAFT_1841976, partial [Baffinella frigidus]
MESGDRGMVAPIAKPLIIPSLFSPLHISPGTPCSPSPLRSNSGMSSLSLTDPHFPPEHSPHTGGVDGGILGRA